MSVATADSEAGLTAPGYYGTLPSRGEFLSSGLPSGFTEPWDDWLQQVIARSREVMGDGWLDAYLTSPIWRFVLSAGVCGPVPVAGVLMPSVDEVGRYFPFTIAAPMPGCTALMDVPLMADNWFVRAERAALSGLDDTASMDDLEAGIIDLGIPDYQDSTLGEAHYLYDRGTSRYNGMRVPMGRDGSVWPAYPTIVDQLMLAAFDRYSVWWTAGSERVSESLLVCRGLPDPNGWSAFMDGAWATRGWTPAGDIVGEG